MYSLWNKLTHYKHTPCLRHNRATHFAKIFVQRCISVFWTSLVFGPIWSHHLPPSFSLFYSPSPTRQECTMLLSILVWYYVGKERCHFVHIRYYYFTGIRSVSFKEDVLTIGTGGGSVHFFDLRANKYLELNCGHTCALTVGEGWLVSILVIIVKIVIAIPSRIGKSQTK